MNFNRIFLLVLVLAMLGFHSSIAQLITKKESAGIDKILTNISATHKPKTYLFKNVSVLTMTDSVLRENQDVLINDGIIAQIGKSIEQSDAIQIDGTGKFLMPGLTDMHVHLYENHQLTKTSMLLLLINGVTSVRDMGGEPGKITLRDNIKRNAVLAPNLYQAGPIINNVNPYGLFVTATTPEEGRSLVIQHKQTGYDFIKVYDGLKKNVFEAILDEANKQNILVVGHIPVELSVREAINAGQNSAEHLNGYKIWDEGKISVADQSNTSLTAQSTLWNCPTLYNFSLEWSMEGAQAVLNNAEAISLLPKGMVENWQKRLKNVSKQARESVSKNGPGNMAVMNEIAYSLYKLKAKLIAGTDAGGIPFLIPGFALQGELNMLHGAGIPIYDVLKMTTINAALSMRKEHEFGTVEPGKRADLLLLDANPLTDLGNLRKKSGLMIRGIWLSNEDLQKISGQIKATFSD